MKKSFNLESIFFVICLGAIILCYINPLISQMVNIPQLFGFSMAFIVLNYVRLSPLARKTFYTIQLLLFLLALLFFLITFGFDTWLTIHTYMYMQLIVAPVFFYLIILSRGSRSERMALLVIILISLIFTFVVTYQAIQINPNASRMVTGMLSDENPLQAQALEFRSQGVASASYAQIYLFLQPVFLGAYLLNKKHRIRFLYLAAYLASFLFVIHLQYGILFFASVVSLGLVIGKVTTKKKVFFYIGFALMFALLPFLFTQLAYFFGDSTIAIRLNDISSFLSTGDTSGEAMSGRTGVYLPAIDLFLSSPIWGNQCYQNGQAIISLDTHSLFLNLLSWSGLLGFGLFIRIVALSYNTIKQQLSKEEWEFMKISVVLFIFICFTDSSLYSIPIYMHGFFIVPLFYHCIIIDR